MVTVAVGMAMWLSVGDYVPEYGESSRVSVPPNVAVSLSVHLSVQCISVCVDGHMCESISQCTDVSHKGIGSVLEGVCVSVCILCLKGLCVAFQMGMALHDSMLKPP